MSVTAKRKPARGVGFGGWLSMAPQTDEVHIPHQPVAVVHGPLDSAHGSPSQPASPSHSPVAALSPHHHASHGGFLAQPATTFASSSAQNASSALRAPPTLTKEQTSASAPSLPVKQLDAPINDLGSNGGGPSAIPRRILPRTNARFSVGGDSSASQLASPASPAPTSPSYSHKSGDGDDSPPPFDVRNSFAPMRWGKGAEAGTDLPVMSARRASEGARLVDNRSGDILIKNDKGTSASPTGMYAQTAAGAAARKRNAINLDMHDSDEVDVHSDDGERVEVAGRRWKGKTANAIEQEMEALGDRTVMSYAPDAVYLASRLEGLRRNLEAGGERFRRWAWEDVEEEDGVDESAVEDGDLPHGAEEVDADTVMESDRRKEDVEVLLDGPTATAQLPPEPAASTHNSPRRLSHRASMSTILSPVQEVPVDPLQTNAVKADDEEAARAINRAAKEAALDSRVEIRTLRRPDLEQVRELHCYHGDGDKEIFVDLQLHHAPLAAVFTTPDNTPNSVRSPADSKRNSVTLFVTQVNSKEGTVTTVDMSAMQQRFDDPI